MKKRYVTVRLPFAAYLHCKQLLTFAGCELVQPKKAAFMFLDPEERGEQLELDFDQGKDTLIDARTFVTSERFLRRKMFSAMGGNGRGR